LAPALALFSALAPTRYSLTTHRVVPFNQEDINNEERDFTGVGRVIPSAPGFDWFLQIGINYEVGTDDRTTLMLGLSRFVDTMVTVIPGFLPHPLDNTSLYSLIPQQ
jgi:hypothetical protein